MFKTVLFVFETIFCRDKKDIKTAEKALVIRQLLCYTVFRGGMNCEV